MPRSIELFAGAGGLAMGISRAGFKNKLVLEWNEDACNTIRHNKSRGIDPVKDWVVFQGDARTFDFAGLGSGIDLIGGGPPCQPFSIGGKHRGPMDERDMFPEAVRAIRAIKPKAFILENVKGLLRQSFAKYFEYIHLQLTYPEVTRKARESWEDHLGRLERLQTKGGSDGLRYNIVYRLLNAADYGVPQKRERVFMVGFRADLGVEWSFPEPTHGEDALLWQKWVTGEYWERHEVAKKNRPSAPPGIRRRFDVDMLPPFERPWRTVRDAIADLPDPRMRFESESLPNHRFQPGARKYAGHTGSPLDEPAKTLKAGDHGVPGGENMLAHPNGEVRYFTVRESARLQTFPDDYVFTGSWSEAMRQLGNAVPVELSSAVARHVHEQLKKSPRWNA